MKNTTLVFLAFAAIMLVASPVVLAQTQYGSDQGKVTAPGQVRKTLSLDNDTINDDIVQLNNLTIERVDRAIGADAAVAVVLARGPGKACLKYFDHRESAGFSYPCPAGAQYQIRVQSNTVLLQRNRALATIADFTVGAHINVYGFLDRGTTVNVDALIMRTLETPSARRYHQINNLQVHTEPGVQVPTSFTAIAQSSPCDMQPAGVPCTMLPAVLQTYQINISAQTQLLYVNRRSMPLSELDSGDRINVYGLFNPAANTFDAVIIRDLSKPLSPAHGEVRVLVASDKQSYNTNENITLTIRAYNNSALAKTLNFNSGCQVSYTIEGYYDQGQHQACTLALTAVTIPAYGTHEWTMVHTPQLYPLAAGTYVIRGSVIGYGSESVKIMVGGGAVSGRAPVITGVSGPAVLALNQTGTWTISAYDLGSGTLAYSVRWGDEPASGLSNMASLPQELFGQTGTFTHSYSSPGVYTVTFTARNSTSGLATTATLTTTVSASTTVPAAPVVSSLMPGTGPVGSSVVINGSGFTPTGNTVYFNTSAITNLSSYDGRIIYFIVPQYLAPYCPPGMFCAQYVQPVTPGSYQVSVNTIHGRSNTANFVVQ